MGDLKVLKTLEKAEEELKDLLANTRDTISIGPKNNQSLVCDALDSVQCAMRTLLMLD